MVGSDWQIALLVQSLDDVKVRPHFINMSVSACAAVESRWVNRHGWLHHQDVCALFLIQSGLQATSSSAVPHDPGAEGTSNKASL